MDNQRIFLYGAFGLLLLLIWQTWQIDYGEPARPAELEEAPDAERVAEDVEDDIPAAPVRPEDEPDPTADRAVPDDATVPAADHGLPRAERVSVVTDLLDITLDLHGADIREARLRQHRETLGGERTVELLTDDRERLFVAQSGLQAGDRDAPTHHARFRAERNEYRLAEGDDLLRVPLRWSGDGVEVTKTYVFHRDNYVVDVEFEVHNTADEPWIGRQYHQFQRHPRGDDGRSSYLIPTYSGAAYYSPENKYTRLSFDDFASDPLDRRIENGWAGVVEHYFVAAWIPERGTVNTYYTRTLDADTRPRYIIGMYSGALQITPGESGRFTSQAYLGSKEQARLSDVAEGLNLTVDYGYMTLLSRPLFWVLDRIHDVVRNWGVAIILLTLLIKLVFYKLSEASYRSMARMRKMQPKIQQIRERYGDDREKMGRQMMDLYKKEKINPLGGCLPILVQIPVFIALFWMLLGSVELRHAPFLLWIQDLSARDPFFILPLLMGVSMYLQQKLNPTPPDPLQQKIFMALPFVFTVFFAFFPAGLVLYWFTNNVLSIAQQYYITRYVVGDGSPLHGNKPKGAAADSGIADAAADGQEEAGEAAGDTDDAAAEQAAGADDSASNAAEVAGDNARGKSAKASRKKRKGRG